MLEIILIGIAVAPPHVDGMHYFYCFADMHPDRAVDREIIACRLQLERLLH